MMVKRILILFLFAVLVVRCGGAKPWRAYPGDKRPKGEIAEIKPSTHLYKGLDAALIVWVKWVDGEVVKSSGISLPLVEVMPGPHKIGIAIEGQYTGGGCTFTQPPSALWSYCLEFDAIAGHVYVIETSLIGNNLSVDLRDTTAYAVVASRPIDRGEFVRQEFSFGSPMKRSKSLPLPPNCGQ